jgi:hypothetical protein
MKVTATMSIQGSGFLLRPNAEDDADLMMAASVSDVTDWTYIPRNLDQASARAWIRRGIIPEFRRRGLATASLQLINKWVQDVTPELRSLQLHVFIGNPGSDHVAKRAGYKLEGIAVNQQVGCVADAPFSLNKMRCESTLRTIIWASLDMHPLRRAFSVFRLLSGSPSFRVLFGTLHRVRDATEIP